MIVGRLLVYCPVAVTPQTTENVIVLPAGSTGKLIPAPCSEAIVTLPAVGQDAAPDTPEQVACVQFKPVANGSFRSVPSPSEGPPLVTVIV